MKRSLKRVAYSLVVLLLWMSFVVDGAHAYFTDSVGLTGNTISTGSADLLISNSQNASSTTYDDTRPGFAFSLTPGETQEKYFLLKNASSANVPFDISVLASAVTGSEQLRSNVDINIFPVDDTGASSGQGIQASLDELLNSQSQIITTIAKGATQRFKLLVHLGFGQNEQDASLGYDLVFNGTQRVVQ